MAMAVSSGVTPLGLFYEVAGTVNARVAASCQSASSLTCSFQPQLPQPGVPAAPQAGLYKEPQLPPSRESERFKSRPLPSTGTDLYFFSFPRAGVRACMRAAAVLLGTLTGLILPKQSRLVSVSAS